MQMATQEMALDRPVETAVALRDQTGVMALAMMDDREFESRLIALKKGQDRVRRIQLELMIGPTKENPEGEDYGVIPGTKKPTLLKPGAEKLCQVYGLVPTFEEEWIAGDGETTPHLRVRVKCFLHRGSKDGPIVGEGAGAANSWERKHRYRAAQRQCPACGVEGTIKRSSFEKNGDKGWYCHAKVGGCNASFHSKDPAIIEQQGGQVDNPDPYDVENTLLKMGTKRAQVDATLRATATSGLFTQDVEDQDHTPPPPPAAGTTASVREPAADDGEPMFDEDGLPLDASGQPLAPEAERVAAAGAEPNPDFESEAAWEAAQERKRRAADPKPAGKAKAEPAKCPKCARMAYPSKFPKAGSTHYCGKPCGTAFEPGLFS
jgi:hypothetical protein